MRILPITAGVLVGVLSATFAVADPSYPLAADDPANGSGWRPPSSPTAGLKAFSPAETKDWLQLNKDVTPSGASAGGMSGMGGDMKGMKGMDGKSPPSSASKKGVPRRSMPGMPGMGTMR